MHAHWGASHVYRGIMELGFAGGITAGNRATRKEPRSNGGQGLRPTLTEPGRSAGTCHGLPYYYSLGVSIHVFGLVTRMYVRYENVCPFDVSVRNLASLRNLASS